MNFCSNFINCQLIWVMVHFARAAASGRSSEARQIQTLYCRSTVSSSGLLENKDRSSGDIGRSSEIRQSRTLDVRSTPRSSEHHILTDLGSSAVTPYKSDFSLYGRTFWLENIFWDRKTQLEGFKSFVLESYTSTDERKVLKHFLEFLKTSCGCEEYFSAFIFFQYSQNNYGEFVYVEFHF